MDPRQKGRLVWNYSKCRSIWNRTVVVHFHSRPPQNSPPRLLDDLPAPPRNPHPPRLLLSNSRNAARTPGSTAFRRHVPRPIPRAGIKGLIHPWSNVPNWLRFATSAEPQIGFVPQLRPPPKLASLRNPGRAFQIGFVPQHGTNPIGFVSQLRPPPKLASFRNPVPGTIGFVPQLGVAIHGIRRLNCANLGESKRRGRAHAPASSTWAAYSGGTRGSAELHHCREPDRHLIGRRTRAGALGRTVQFGTVQFGCPRFPRLRQSRPARPRCTVLHCSSATEISWIASTNVCRGTDHGSWPELNRAR